MWRFIATNPVYQTSRVMPQRFSVLRRTTLANMSGAVHDPGASGQAARENRPAKDNPAARDARTADDAWAVPPATGPVTARLRLPGSKSMTNRALIIAVLATGPTVIRGPLRARDTRLMTAALARLGSRIDDSGDDEWRVGPGQPLADARVDVGNAGTVMRFTPPAAALTSVNVQFHGDARASQRPVAAIIDGLRDLGAVIDDGGRGAIPFTVRGTGSVPGGVVTLDASASSQLVSGLLLAAPRFDKGVEIRHRGPRTPSAPHIAMTVQMLRAAGADIETSTQDPGHSGRRPGLPDTWVVHPGVVRGGVINVEPDLSNAAPFLAAAMVTGGTVTVAGWPREPVQAGEQILDVLSRMGAAAGFTPGGLAVSGRGTIEGITADLSDVNELTPVLTALAALGRSPSVFTGIGHQRFQETDRLAALATEINALGGDVRELPDGLEIHPRPLRAPDPAGLFASYDDHRLVMAGAVLGLAVPGIRVQNAATVGKTFPGFPKLWAAMLEPAP